MASLSNIKSYDNRIYYNNSSGVMNWDLSYVSRKDKKIMDVFKAIGDNFPKTKEADLVRKHVNQDTIADLMCEQYLKSNKDVFLKIAKDKQKELESEDK